jgi:hypothetical protein
MAGFATRVSQIKQPVKVALITTMVGFTGARWKGDRRTTWIGDEAKVRQEKAKANA